MTRSLHSTLALSLYSCAIAYGGEPNPVKLPPPYQTPNVSNGAKIVSKPDTAQLKVPDGFAVTEFASGFQKPRLMLLGPSGEILVADSVAKGGVYVLTDADGDGKPDGPKKALIEGLDRPFGLAFWKDYLYVAEPTSLKRYKYDKKAMSAAKGEEVVSMTGFDKGHWSRTVTFDAKGEKLYLNIGSGSNADPDSDPRRATVQQCNPDGSACQEFAGGLRNVTGLHFRPGSSDLWISVQERDGLGEDLVPDFFSRIQKGQFFGWPWAYFGPNEDPRNAGKKPDLVKKTVTPDLSLGAHVSAMDFAFYTGKQFPAKYRGGAFIAFRGSSNKTKRTGYNISYIPFGKDGKPASAPQEFLTGWMLSPDEREVWGRPVGVVQARDGSLLVSDDGGNKIWRIAYRK